MKWTCSRELLLNYINIVNKAVSNRTTLPILECILITAQEDGLILTATDLEFGIQTNPIKAEVSQTGQIALEARLFTEIIRKINGTIISFTSDEKNAATIECDSSKFQIMGQEGEEFPQLPVVEKNQPYVMKQSNLKNMIRQTIFSIAQDDMKPILTGEYFELEENNISIVSIDGFRISYRKNPLIHSSKKSTMIIPGKILNELQKILSQEEEEEVSIYLSEKQTLFELGDSIVVSRLMEGDYIKYQQNFQEEYKTKVLLSREEMIQALERVSLVSRDLKKTPVIMEISGNHIILNAKGEFGSAREEVHVTTEGNQLDIAFNPKYFIDALRAIEDEKVSLSFTTPLSPCIIRPVEGNHFQYLILPLRV